MLVDLAGTACLLVQGPFGAYHRRENVPFRVGFFPSRPGNVPYSGIASRTTLADSPPHPPRQDDIAERPFRQGNPFLRISVRILIFDLLQKIILIYMKNSPTARRKTIMAYLAGLSGKEEVGLLVDQLTTGFPEDGVEGLSLAKLTGFIRLSEHIYASMPSGVVPHAHRLISLTIHILRHALGQISANRPAQSGVADVDAPITVASTASPEHVPMEISEPGSNGEHPTASGRRKRKAAASPPTSRGKRRKEEPKPTSPPEEVPAVDDEIPEEEQEEEVIGGAPSKEAGYSTSQWVDLRNHCIRRIGEAVAGIDEIEWVKYLPDFLDLIGPMVPRLSADCRSGPSAVMEALLSIACQVPTVPLLAERGFLEPMFACLSLPNGVPSLVLPLLDVIEGLISMAQDTPPVDLLTPLASHLLSHLLPGSLSAKRQLRFCYPLSMHGNKLTLLVVSFLPLLPVS